MFRLLQSIETRIISDVKLQNEMDNMSQFENYNKTSQNYDKTRSPSGMEIILGCLATLQTPLEQMTVLDAGCGTGNYSLALIPHVDQIEAVDLNPKMLEIASGKLKPFILEGRIRLHCGDIVTLPFANETFDAVLINQVLHHLKDSASDQYPIHCQIFQEIHRTLKPGGLVIINTCSQEQIRRGFWFYPLFPETVEQYCQIYMPLDTLQALLEECEFTMKGRFVGLDTMLRQAVYFDPEGPLKKEWRDGDSFFALVTGDQLDRACEEIRARKANGTLISYMEEQDRSRKYIGQNTFLCVSRGASNLASHL